MRFAVTEGAAPALPGTTIVSSPVGPVAGQSYDRKSTLVSTCSPTRTAPCSWTLGVTAAPAVATGMSCTPATGAAPGTVSNPTVATFVVGLTVTGSPGKCQSCR